MKVCRCFARLGGAHELFKSRHDHKKTGQLLTFISPLGIGVVL